MVLARAPVVLLLLLVRAEASAAEPEAPPSLRQEYAKFHGSERVVVASPLRVKDRRFRLEVEVQRMKAWKTVPATKRVVSFDFHDLEDRWAITCNHAVLLSDEEPLKLVSVKASACIISVVIALADLDRLIKGRLLEAQVCEDEFTLDAQVLDLLRDLSREARRPPERRGRPVTAR